MPAEEEGGGGERGGERGGDRGGERGGDRGGDRFGGGGGGEEREFSRGSGFVPRDTPGGGGGGGGAPPERRKLQLAPRTGAPKPADDATGDAASAKSNPFGAAKARPPRTDDYLGGEAEKASSAPPKPDRGEESRQQSGGAPPKPKVKIDPFTGKPVVQPGSDATPPPPSLPTEAMADLEVKG
jgi:hypothetical protein